MKKILFFLLIGIGSGQLASAQSASKKTVTPSGFSSDLAQGKLTFTKTFQPGDGKLFKAVYTLANNENASSHNGKKITVTLSKSSLENFFSTNGDIAPQWAAVNKFITDNKLSLDEEKGWVAAIQHFNNMQQ